MRLLLPLLLLVAACATPSVPTAARSEATPAPAAIARVTPAQAKAIADGRRGVIVDVRSREEYEQRRIAGAVHAPVEAVQADPRLPVLAGIPADQELILYCT
jgi:3-mercaptopyruvate sulfurtransferase SseA